MQPGESFVAKFHDWKKITGDPQVEIKLIAPLIVDGNPYAYFMLIGRGANINRYPFRISRLDEGFGPKFISDYTANCYDIKHCTWAARMKEYVEEMYNDRNSVAKILSAAVRLYKEIVLRTKRSDNISPSKQNPVTISNDKPMSRVSALMAAAGNCDGNIFKIKVQNIREWTIHIKGHYSDIEAAIFIPEDTYKCPTLTVVKPRLKLGRNVSFGGLVLYQGLTQHTWDRDISQIPFRILNALYNEQEDIDHYQLYGPEEQRACELKCQYTNAGTFQMLGEFVVNIEAGNVSDNSDMIEIPERFYAEYIGGSNYLTVRILTKLGVNGWYKIHPSPNIESIITISPLQAINLNVRALDKVSLFIHTPAIINDALHIRPRQPIPHDDLLYEIDKLSILTVGHTISYLHQGQVKYSDIISFGGAQSAFMRNERGGQIPINILNELVKPKMLKELSPLAIDYTEYSSEKEDENEL
jgi:hypothetical protein